MEFQSCLFLLRLMVRRSEVGGGRVQARVALSHGSATFDSGSLGSSSNSLSFTILIPKVVMSTH